MLTVTNISLIRCGFAHNFQEVIVPTVCDYYFKGILITKRHMLLTLKEK